MNQDSDILEVVKTEYHAWRVCPCQACQSERERRAPANPSLPGSRLTRLSADAAYLFGFIRRRNPHGSLARELMLKRS